MAKTDPPGVVMKRESFAKGGIGEAVSCGTAGEQEEPLYQRESDRVCVLCLGDYVTEEDDDEVLKNKEGPRA